MKTVVGLGLRLRKPPCACGTCVKCKQRVRNESRTARRRERRLRDPEKTRAEDRVRNEKFLDARREAVRRAAYGLGAGEYVQQLAAQGGVCALCKQPETRRNGRTGKLFALSVDHCHGALILRALLCFRCNARIGQRECLDWLREDIAYLKEHCSPAVELLKELLR